MFNIGDKVIRKSDILSGLNNPVLYNCPNGLPQPKTIYVVNKITSDLLWGNKIAYKKEDLLVLITQIPV